MKFNKDKFDELTNSLYTASNDEAVKMQEIERVAYAKGRRDGYREGIIAVVSIVLADNSGVLAEEPKAEYEKEKK